MQTVYVRNLNEKMTCNKLKKALENLFNSSGYKVLDLHTYKNQRLRGQAFVSFDKNVSLEDLMDKLNTEMLYGKPIHLQIAKSNSDFITQKNLNSEQFQLYLEKEKIQRLKKRTKLKEDSSSNKRKLEDRTNDINKNFKQPYNKRVKETPNKMMILTSLPDSTDQQVLIDIFSKFTGFLTVNYVSVRHLALIEFQTEETAVECYQELGTKIKVNEKTDCILAFAKK
jgi:RNA recognition motif-containing protein